MPTAIKSISAAWTPVAQGPGEVVFSFNDDYGRFTLHSSSDPAAIAGGHKQPPDTPFKLTLASGDFLHLRGRGVATVSATTLI